MTSDELTDLRAIAAAVHRIEEKQQQDSHRLDTLERFADKADGAITLAKWALGFVGAGGISMLIFALSKGG